MKNKIISFIKKYYLSFLSIITFIILWEVVSRLKIINPLFISSPFQIFKEGVELILSGEIYPHFLASMKSYFAGIILAIILGTIGGLIIGFKENLYRIFLPFVLALNSLPTIAIIPLVIIWFGIGLYAKIIIVFIMAVKPILINTIDAVQNIEKSQINMAKSFGASPNLILRNVVFFSALPYIFSSYQIAIGRGIIGLVVGEMFGYGKGLGFLVSFYGNTFQTTRLTFVVVLLLVVNLMMSNFVYVIEKKIIRWK